MPQQHQSGVIGARGAWSLGRSSDEEALYVSEYMTACWAWWSH